MQNSVFDVGVFCTVGVVFLFVVAPAAVANFKTPMGGVDGGAIEFVCPEKVWVKRHF